MESLTVSTLSIIQIAARLDAADQAYIDAREALKEAANNDAPSSEILDRAKKLHRAESALDKLSEQYANACVVNYRRIRKELEKAQKRFDAQAKKEERERVQARLKAEKDAKRAVDRKAAKRAKALDRCSKLHLAALESKIAAEKLVADRITDEQIEEAIDACADLKDAGRIAFARVMFCTAYARQREVFTKIGILEAEGLIAVAAKYERILVKAGVNSLSLREEVNHAA